MRGLVKINLGAGMIRVVTKLVVFIVFVGCGVTALAQPRLDSRTLPSATKAFVLAVADTTGVTPGLAGPNVLWDFSQIKRRGTGADSVQMQYMLPSATPPPARSMFPTAQVAVRTGSSYEFFRTEGTMFRSLGVWTPSVSLTSGTANPYDTRPVEITFNGQHTDQYRATITQITPPQTAQRAGNHKIVYDGYGVLRLPTGEVSDVARTQTTITTTDTVRITSPTPRVVITTTITVAYRWISVNDNVPWVIFSNQTVQVSENGQPVSNVSTREVLFRDFSSSTDVDPELQDADVIVYPNPSPATGDITIANFDHDVLSARLIDARGIAINVQATRQGNDDYVVAMHGITTGSYTLVLITKNGVLRRRVIVLQE